MHLADDAGAIAIDSGQREYFIYYGRMEDRDDPMEETLLSALLMENRYMEDATHVQIDSSVRAIKKLAFHGLRRMRIVIFNEELEEIGQRAFVFCTSLGEIVIPNNVRAIKRGAFAGCSGLTSVTLGDGAGGDWEPGICILHIATRDGHTRQRQGHTQHRI